MKKNGPSIEDWNAFMKDIKSGPIKPLTPRPNPLVQINGLSKELITKGTIRPLLNQKDKK